MIRTPRSGNVLSGRARIASGSGVGPCEIDSEMLWSPIPRSLTLDSTPYDALTISKLGDSKNADYHNFHNLQSTKQLGIGAESDW